MFNKILLIVFTLLVFACRVVIFPKLGVKGNRLNRNGKIDPIDPKGEAVT